MSRPRMNRFSCPANVTLIRARGREYFYHQQNRGTKRASERAPLPGCPFNPDGSPNEAWCSRYRELEGHAQPSARAGTFRALVEAYERSPEWAELGDRWRAECERYHRVIVRHWGELDVKLLQPKHVKALRDAYAEIPPPDPRMRNKPLRAYRNRPAAANHLVAALTSLIAWSVPEGWRADNPAHAIKDFKGGDGYEPWPMRYVEFYQRHGKPHLWWVVAVALYTGQRMGDVLAMEKAHVRRTEGGYEIRVVPAKTKARTGSDPLWIRCTAISSPRSTECARPWRPSRRRASQSTCWSTAVASGGRLTGSRRAGRPRCSGASSGRSRGAGSCFMGCASRPSIAFSKPDARQPTCRRSPVTRFRWSSTMRGRSISRSWLGPRFACWRLLTHEGGTSKRGVCKTVGPFL